MCQCVSVSACECADWFPVLQGVTLIVRVLIGWLFSQFRGNGAFRHWIRNQGHRFDIYEHTFVKKKVFFFG